MNKVCFIHKNIFSSALRNETVTSPYDSDCLKMDLFKGMRTINHSCRKSQLLTTLAKFKIFWRTGAEDVQNHIGLKVTNGQAMCYFHFTAQS